tara:strand:- start:535 stop:651 length:117 start_codon:yes stop_codon:yes gene_type:complete
MLRDIREFIRELKGSGITVEVISWRPFRILIKTAGGQK